MSFLRPASSSSKAAFRNTTAIRHYAGKPDTSLGDPKRENLRRALYPSNIRNRPTPVGTWRPDVARALQRAIPSVQAHETIERAWLLHKRHVRKQREAELSRKFEKMREAMDELYKLDSQLYLQANRADDPRAKSAQEMEMAKKLKVSEVRTMDARIPGLFPRELKVPTDTPSRTGWNYDYKPFQRPL
ncbi:hypothetical protein D9611_005069 [Ephemerocybe angulata]|nr:hypothetical protein D9611_005069 [Tulosesus angulatus]